MHQSVRAVLLTPTGLVLLMKVAGEIGDLWITPGGRIRPGEDRVLVHSLRWRHDARVARPGAPEIAFGIWES